MSDHGNRYCWEQNSQETQSQPQRCMCGLKVIQSARSDSGLSGQTNQFYNLLTTYEEATKRLTFTFLRDGYKADDRPALAGRRRPAPGFARPQHEDG